MSTTSEPGVSDTIAYLVDPAPADSARTASESRVPPQDIHAEQSVLGSMLLSKDAIADCVEVVRSHDFYRPAHETIYGAILDVYSRGEPADPITVADELTKRGELQRIGGQAALLQLVSAVPTAANAAYYAEIVAERAVLRRLVDAGTRIVSMGYGQGGDVEDIVNAAQAEVYAVADKRGGEDYHLLGELLEPTIDEIEANAGKDGEMSGVPTDFIDFDNLTNGLHPGQMIVIAARPAVGKALALETPLPTPSGWTTMGEVQVGDQLLGPDGGVRTVVAATDVMQGRPCYAVEFSDGECIVADAEHLWLTDTRASRGARTPAAARGGSGPRWVSPQVRTTLELAKTVVSWGPGGRYNHSVGVTRALQLPAAELPIPAYTLGAWLAAGHRHEAVIGTVSWEVLFRIQSDGVTPTPVGSDGAELPDDASVVRWELRWGSPVTLATHPEGVDGVARRRTWGWPGGTALKPRLRDSKQRGRIDAQDSAGELGDPGTTGRAKSVLAALRSLDVLRNPHIPVVYGRASERQRRELLAGILDAKGAVTASGSVQVAVRSARLAADVQELALTLGYRCVVEPQRVRNRGVFAGKSVGALESVAHMVTIMAEDDVFASTRLAEAHRLRRATRPVSKARWIQAVKPVPSVPVRCLQVDGGDHLFLAGRSMVPTHNSTFALDIARGAAIKHQQCSVVFSLEMSKNEIVMRLLSAEASIPLQNMRKGTMRDEDWQKLARAMGAVSDAPLYIDDSPNMSLMEIRAKCRRLKQKHNLKLVIIDYLQLMSSGKRVESRQQEVSEFSRALKLLAKELEVPVIALSQLNRGPEQRTDKRPQTSDLRESGCLTADTQVMRADTGAPVSLGELFASGERDIPVWTLDESLRYVRRPLTHVFSTGVKPVFKLVTASGKHIRATANHPLLTQQGWHRVDELTVGSKVAVPRHTPGPVAHEQWGADEVTTAAWLVAAEPKALIPSAVFALSKSQIALFLRSLYTYTGGVMLVDSSGAGIGSGRPPEGGQIMLFTPRREVADRASLLLLRFGIASAVSADGPEWVVDIDDVDSQRRFLQEIGIDGPSAGDAKRLLWLVRAQADSSVSDDAEEPKTGVNLPRIGAALAGVLSLHHRRDTKDGAGVEVGADELPEIDVAVPSAAEVVAQMVADVTVEPLTPAGLRFVSQAAEGSSVDVAGVPLGSIESSMEAAALGVPFKARSQSSLEALGASLPLGPGGVVLLERPADPADPSRRAELPTGAGAPLSGWSRPGPAPTLAGKGSGAAVWGSASPASDGALPQVAEVLAEAGLDVAAVNDVAWDAIVSITPDGVEEVFDATVVGKHNFIANGVVVHNSIEQDADMVILLHRESMYEQDSPREGEADIIVAKHRNGPTATITLAFQGHYSRFANMATTY